MKMNLTRLSMKVISILLSWNFLFLARVKLFGHGVLMFAYGCPLGLIALGGDHSVILDATFMVRMKDYNPKLKGVLRSFNLLD
jgi:hypothetical protein